MSIDPSESPKSLRSKFMSNDPSESPKSLRSKFMLPDPTRSPKSPRSKFRFFKPWSSPALMAPIQDGGEEEEEEVEASHSTSKDRTTVAVAAVPKPPPAASKPKESHHHPDSPRHVRKTRNPHHHHNSPLKSCDINSEVDIGALGLSAWTEDMRVGATRVVEGMMAKREREMDSMDRDIKEQQTVVFDHISEGKNDQATICAMRDLQELELEKEHAYNMYKELKHIAILVWASDVPIDYKAKISAVIVTPRPMARFSRDDDLLHEAHRRYKDDPERQEFSRAA